ncbi:MAG: cysteine synthase family protein [Armatimonadetes bacterium]|nr:cysteine synthase family protein [Armatimonadota bacterium]
MPAHVLNLIGNTPLLRLQEIARDLNGVEIYAKAEWFNPGGSVKDRPAANIIREAERTGQLTRDKILLDATSGNTGIAYAMICAARGYRARLCMPATASEERQRILRAYGADMVLTNPREGSDGAIREARRLFSENPDLYFYADQYSNPANWQAHYRTTAPEIWEQTQGRITHFIAGLGTSGTFVGTARRLRELNPNIRLISFQPDAPLHGLEGLKHMATAIVPCIYDPELADEDRRVPSEAAYAMMRRLAREEGLLVGSSGAAAAHVALEVAREIRCGVVVTLFPDSGTRYLSEERLWNEV